MYKHDDIFQIIQKYLHNQYPDIKEINHESNWYTDLGLTSWDRWDFYAWAEKEFAIKIPYIHFTTIGAISEEIYKELQKKHTNSQINLWQRIKQKFTRHR